STLPWGDNPGDLGDNLPAIPVGGAAVEVATGWYHTCARLDTGAVRCWGRNDYGELGLSRSGQVGDAAGEVGDATLDPLVNLGAGRSAVAVDGGAYMTCAALDDGTVKCWGYSSDERLGATPQANRGLNTATMGDNLPLTEIGQHKRAIDVAVGEAHACALLDDGDVKCWGYNNYGQLGYEDVTNRGTHEREMGDWLRPVNLGGGTVVEVDAGRYHTCARFVDGRVKCWGYNGYGQLGQGNTTQRGDDVGEMGTALAYTDLGPSRYAVSLQAGEYHTCAALDNGTVKCWGNAQGLGYEGTVRRGDNANEMGGNLPVVALPAGTSITQVTTGGGQSCGLTACGELYCWGANNYGQVGVGVVGATIAAPVAPIDFGTLHYVPSSTAQACNVNRRPSAPVIDVVRVGPPDAYDLRCTLVTPSVDADGDAIHYSLSWEFEGAPYTGFTLSHTLANDTVPASQIEVGRYTCVATPYDAGGAGDAGRDGLLAYDPALDVVDTWGTHVCAALDDGSVKCMGYNAYGQLGIGSTTAWGTELADLGDNAIAVNLGAGHTAVEVATGWYHTCALLDDGKVRCWGRNDYGELGLGKAGQIGDAAGEVGDDTLDPVVDLGTGRAALRVDAGSSMTCAVLDNGKVKCWGYSADERLGATPQANRGLNLATVGDNMPYTELGDRVQAIDVAVGEAHACALIDDGSVKCWGYNGYGQLGYGDTTNRGTHERETGDWMRTVNLGGGTVVEVDAGRYHSCARMSDGRVKCWGYNGYGQLGYGNTTQLGDDVGEMGAALPYVDLGAGRAAVSLQLGEYHTCAALDDGTVKCWGNDQGLGYAGTLRRGDNANEMGDNLPAVAIPGGAAVDQVVAGGGAACAITTCGEIYCWGENAYGQMGNGASGGTYDVPALPMSLGTSRYAPTRSGSSCKVNRRPGAPRVGFVHEGPATAFNLRCAVTTGSPDPDGDAVRYRATWKKEGVAWTGPTSSTVFSGDTIAAGDVGTGLWTCTVTPADGVGDGTPATESHLIRALQRELIDGGGDFGCAIHDDGTVRCWGRNQSGQLGIGNVTTIGDSAAELGNALQAVNLGAGRTAVEVATGLTHACALLDNGTVRCWGSQAFGEIGTGGTVNIGDQAGEVGDPTLDPVVDLGAGRTAIAIDAGDSHTCAILDNGQVKCWGSSSGERLGFGPASDRGRSAALMGDNLPAIDLGAGRTAIDISTGFGHTCALLDNGDLKCWGFNNYGQLGQGDGTSRGVQAREMGDYLLPIALGTGYVVDVTTGYDHTCALMDGGRVKCWGRNDSGQSGYGDVVQRGDAANEMGSSLPVVSLGTGRTAKAIRAGAYHTCALLDNNTVKCWGYSQGAGGAASPVQRGDAANEMGDNLPVISMPGAASVDLIGGGGSWSCAVTSCGAMYCWGQNPYGQLGI
ncbi:MAG TPA: hypothetical protein PKA64_10095, partial [Myxococcota bacterium]|nr:hypothetical protein [Myxococcota bacterium]